MTSGSSSDPDLFPLPDESPVHASGTRAPPPQASLDEYLSTRLEPQLNWYEGKSTAAKRMFWRLALVQFGSTALIPVFNALSRDYGWLLYVSSLMAAASAISAAVIAIGAYQDNWIRYRHAANAMQGLRLRHLHGVPPFDGPDRDQKLVELVEDAIEAESGQWSIEMRSSIPRR